MDDVELHRRAHAVLRALAAGDAMGAATEGLLPDEVLAVYEAPVTELVEPVNRDPERSEGRARGAIGPVTRSALAAADRLSGAATGTLDVDALGWAVTLGIVSPAGGVAPVVQGARQVAAGVTAAAGAAVAAAIAAGLGGFMARDMVSWAALAAREVGAPDLAERIVAAAGVGQASGGRQAGALVGAQFPPGPDPATAVAFAFGVAFSAQSVRRAIAEAVNQGGPASLTAGLAGAICAAVAPASAVESWADEVERTSGLDLAAVADRLLRIRAQRTRT